MTNKKFIAYEIKCWIPIFVLSLIFMSIVFWIDVASMNILYHPPYEYATYLNHFGSSGLFSAIIPAMLLTLVYPLSIFDYRFSKNKADTFLQLPLKEKQLKRTRLNISLSVLLIGFTITFWIGVLFLLIRINSVSLSAELIEEGYTVSPYNFLAYLFAYLLSLVLIAAEFYTNAFLVQLGNTAREGTTYLMMGQVILLLVEFSFHVYIAGGLLGLPYFQQSYPQPATFSIGTPIYLIYVLFDGYAIGASPNPGFAAMTVNEWANLIVVFLIGIAAAIALYLLPDPSGEYYGKQGPRNLLAMVIPHCFFFLVGLQIFRLGALPLFLMLYLLFVLGYYMSLASLYRTFRIPKREVIIMASISGAILFLSIVPLALNGGYYIY